MDRSHVPPPLARSVVPGSLLDQLEGCRLTPPLDRRRTRKWLPGRRRFQLGLRRHSSLIPQWPPRLRRLYPLARELGPADRSKLVQSQRRQNQLPGKNPHLSHLCDLGALASVGDLSPRPIQAESNAMASRLVRPVRLRSSRHSGQMSGMWHDPCFELGF
jgi:hypothetical protein